MEEDCREPLGPEDEPWEPQEACSAPDESSDYSDAPANARGSGVCRTGCDAGLVRRRRRRPVWSRLEEAILARQHSIRGNAWSAIAEHLPGRSASEVKNIWHSTLRSKKLKSRSLLRAYAREVQERGDSAAARLEAFRSAVKLTKGVDDTLLESGSPRIDLNGKTRRPSASSDDKDADEHDSGSPRAHPHVADISEATHIAKRLLAAQCHTGSSEEEGADTACLTSDRTSPCGGVPPALRTDHLSSRAPQQQPRRGLKSTSVRPIREAYRPAGAPLPPVPPAWPALLTGRRDEAGISNAAETDADLRRARSYRLGAETARGRQQQQRRQHVQLQQQEKPPGDTGRLGSRRRRDLDDDSEPRAAAASTRHARSTSTGLPTGAFDLPQHDVALQQLVLQQHLLQQPQLQLMQQQQLAPWAVTAVPELGAAAWGAPPRGKQERLPGKQQQQQQQEPGGVRRTAARTRNHGASEEALDTRDGGRGAEGRAGAGAATRLREAMDRAAPQDRTEDDPNQLPLRMIQGFAQRGQLSYPKIEEGTAITVDGVMTGSIPSMEWVQAQRWIPVQARTVALGLAQAQAMAQAHAQASALEEEAYRLALLREFLARQALQQQQGHGQGRQAEYGEEGLQSAAAAEEVDGADGAWAAADKVAFGGGEGGVLDDGLPQHLAPARGASGRQATRRASGTANAADAITATVTGALGSFCHNDLGSPMDSSGAQNASINPFAAAMAAAAAAAAGSGVGSFDAYSMLALQQHLSSGALGLSHLGAMFGGGDVDAARVLAAHSAAAAAMAAADANAAAAAAAAQRLAWRRQAVASAWQAEADDPGVATGPSSADTVTTIDLRAQESGAAALKHGKGFGRRARGVAAPSSASAGEAHGSKRRAEADMYDGGDPRAVTAVAPGRMALRGNDADEHHVSPALRQAALARLQEMYDIRYRIAGLYGAYGNPFAGVEAVEDGAAATTAADWGAVDASAAALWGLPAFNLRGHGAVRDRLSAPGTGTAAPLGAGASAGRAPRRRAVQQQQPDVEEPQEQQQERPQEKRVRDQPPQAPQQQQKGPDPKRQGSGHLQKQRRRQPPPPQQRKEEEGQQSEQQQQQQQQQQQEERQQGRERQGPGPDREEGGPVADPPLCDFDVARALLSFSRQQPRQCATDDAAPTALPRSDVGGDTAGMSE